MKEKRTCSVFCISLILCFILPASAALASAPNLMFSHERGFYDASFDLTMTSDLPGAIIYYTLNGSDPSDTTLALGKLSEITITIDPQDETNRFKAPAVIVRALAVLNDTTFSTIETHTYLFVNQIIALSPDGQSPGTGWPAPNHYNESKQFMIYGLDPNVYNDSEYKDQMTDAFTDIPTLSLVTDLKHLFDSNTGIFVNAKYHGRLWERPGSIELLNPDGTEGFQSNAGIRIRGGFSRHNDYPKHAFRLFFRKEYGNGKLNYPLFGDEGVDFFDKVDLRTTQNYSWANSDEYAEYCVMNRDVFSRDLQGETGHPYTRSRYYHLYINGVYWGIYQTQERAEAAYAASYFGGDRGDYDVVKVDIGEDWQQYYIEATDGNLHAWQSVYNQCNTGFRSNLDYFRIQGLDVTGNPFSAYPKYVDVENLIDYMLIIFYAGNFDAPISKWFSNQRPNNFYAIFNRVQRDGFRFFIQDAEHSLITGIFKRADGVQENRVNLGSISGRFQMKKPNFNRFHPQWLHYRLSENPNYRMHFADRVYRYFFNNGAMTFAPSRDRFRKRAEEIEMAIIAESARWGDTKIEPPSNKNDHWEPMINEIVEDYLAVRTEIVLQQLKDEALYPSIDPPTFSHSGGLVSQTTQLTLQAGTGKIYYTTDGSDPRKIIEYNAAETYSAAAIEYTGPIVIDTHLRVNARAFAHGEWSALNQAEFWIKEKLGWDLLKVTEIHYHPLDGDTVNDSEYEFIELFNSGDSTLNLSGTGFSDGIVYHFGDESYLEPGDYVVLASDSLHFFDRYQFYPDGMYEGQLRNSGEILTYNGINGDTLFTLYYGDDFPWPKSADGDGYSLELHNLNDFDQPYQASNWRASTTLHGTPAAGDTTAIHTEPATAYLLHQNYPNPFNSHTYIEFSIPNSEKVSVTVYDIMGRKVATLFHQITEPRWYQIRWDPSGLASGIYMCRLQSGSFVETRKMMLMK